MNLTVERNCVTELCFNSTATYGDPFNEVEMDVDFTAPDGRILRVPSFWVGGQRWKVRFSASSVGTYGFETHASDEQDGGLDGRTGTVTVNDYTGNNRLFRHGRLRISESKDHFEFSDRTPFFWLADTWWMGLAKRLDWPQAFKELVADRVGKGFNGVQIVAGPYPDMDAWDPRGKNEAGFPFADAFKSVNPAYYDQADLKIGHLVHSGLMPCIVGMWGYYLPQIGVEKAKRFWRHLVARYGAYPVVWCICGEGTMPYYLSETREADAEMQREGWSQVMAYVREIDPFGNLITIHPTRFGREQIIDPGIMDFEMLQTGHGGVNSVQASIDMVRQSVPARPQMPVIVAETNYEGIRGNCWQNIQRLSFYHSVLNGAAGHTYGANGLWQMNTQEAPYGPSPHGRCWGGPPWPEAAGLPGARQVALGGQFLQRFPWWRMEVHPEWIGQCSPSNDPMQPLAVGVPKAFRIVYIPMCWDPVTVRSIEADVSYRAYYFDPCTGDETDSGQVVPDSNGNWPSPIPPECHDWLLVLDARGL